MKRYLNILFVLMLTPFIFACNDDDDDISFTEIRVVHGSADAPAVDVLVDDGVAFEGASFKDATDYAVLVADTYNIKIVPTGLTEPVVFEADLPLEAGKKYTALALGSLTATPSTFDVIPLVDNAENMPDKAQLRVIHGSTFADTASPNGVDLYVNAPGMDINSESPAVQALVFKDNTGYVALDEGTYEVTATATGDKGAVTPTPVTITLEKGKIYNVIATDADSNFAGLDLILLDSFND